MLKVEFNSILATLLTQTEFKGRYQMKWQIGISIFIMVLLFSFSAAAGKKHCQNYRKKLDSIQAQQRQANSLKRSNSLTVKEAKARKNWWRCETGKLKEKSKEKQQPKKKARAKKSNTIAIQHSIKIKPKRNIAKMRPLAPFANSRPVVLRAKYQGKQLQAWLEYYQPKKKCARPKSTQIFAACVEDKRRQQDEFDKNYIK